MNDDPLAPILVQVAAQDRTAFRALYTAAAPKLMGVLFRILGTRPEAEDAMQDVFTRIWLRAASYDPEKGRAMTWMITMARNHAIDRLRARPAPMGDDDDLNNFADPAPRMETQLIAAGEARRINDCMAELEPRHGQALRGAYLSGKSYAELASAFDVPLNTMRTWLRRGLLSLKECMKS
jgi:RNA polymerase sigma-70 factor (ECF subfamily)